MTEQTNFAISFSFEILGFLFMDKSIQDKVRAVYLFGSSVRSELGPKSDIDIFIDCDTKNKQAIKKAAVRAESRFRKSKNFDKWKYFNFVYPISFQTGSLDEWEAKGSIMSEGILLFSKTVTPQNFEHWVLFQITLPKTRAQYLTLMRALYGRKEKNFLSKGLIEEAGGKRLSNEIFLVSKEMQKTVTKFLHSHRIPFTMTEIMKTVV